MSVNEPPFTNESQGMAPLGPGLNARYTFEAFIVGSSNRLAHAASLAVAEKPGVSYNPLFLYGGVGLGKTHLLHAIGHRAVDSGLVVLYISSETFTNDIVNAIRYRSTEEFRAKYRSVDVLLVDDIQFIAGKESTEEEFFHTFNSLYEASKQIVICSDRPPKSIPGLEERLRSRFEWGLIADIQPPDMELRIAILRSKVDLMQRIVPNDVIDFVARRVDTNIRELEGSLNRVLVFAELTQSELTVEVAREALQNLAIDFTGNQPSLQQIVRAVADYYHVPEADLRGKQRDRRVVLPRQVAMFLMHTETDASSSDIGRELGGRDHSTAIHGYEKITEEIKTNSTLKREIEAIRLMLYR